MSAEVKDQYKIAHKKSLAKLKECKSRVKDSCMPCKDFFDCQTRAEYVKATYKSMSKDKDGGFEF